MTAPKKTPARKAAPKPATALVPQDHKPPAPAKPKVTRTPDGGCTVKLGGTAFVLPAKKVNSTQLFRALLSDDGNTSVPAIERLFGDDYDEVVHALGEAAGYDDGDAPFLGPGSLTELVNQVIEAINPS